MPEYHTETIRDGTETKMPDKPWASYMLALANLAEAIHAEIGAQLDSTAAAKRLFDAQAATLNAKNEKSAAEHVLMDTLRANLARDAHVEALR